MTPALRLAGFALLIVAATLVGHCMNHATGYYDTHPHAAPDWLP